jgi:hypothetical protein
MPALRSGETERLDFTGGRLSGTGAHGNLADAPGKSCASDRNCAEVIKLSGGGSKRADCLDVRRQRRLRPDVIFVQIHRQVS